MLGDEYDVKEEGLSGRTTVFDDPLSEGLNGLTMITLCLLTHKPVDLLIVMLGTNDTKERFACTPENITFGMEHLLRKAADTWDAWRTFADQRSHSHSEQDAEVHLIPAQKTICTRTI